MTRNFGLPVKPDDVAFRSARHEKPVATLVVTAIFGILGAALAAISFNEARELFSSLFHGRSLVGAIVAAGFGCWMYIWLARPRFAAHFQPKGDPFSDLLRFYAKAGLILMVIYLTGRYLTPTFSETISGMALCAAGGAAAAAAFQTVLAFVPAYENGQQT